MKCVVVFFSGGFDSIVCFYWVKKNYDEVIMLIVNYGSNEEKVINKVVEFFLKELDVLFKIVRLDFFEEFLKFCGMMFVGGEMLKVIGEEFENIEVV